MSAIVVTGAARGIGHVLVKRAVARGDKVIACIRKEQDKEKFTSADNLYFAIMDVSSTESVADGFRQIDAALADDKLHAVVNSAAISLAGAVEHTPVEEFEAHYNTNTLGSIRVMKEALPRLRGHDGRMILVTSLWGHAAGPMLGGYCSSKHAIEALADITRRETVGQDVNIVVVEPGVVLTEMYSGQGNQIRERMASLDASQQALYGNYYQRYIKLVGGGGKGAITAEKAAENIERAIFDARPKRRYKFGMDSKVVCAMTWLLPTAVMDFLLKQSLNNKPL